MTRSEFQYLQAIAMDLRARCEGMYESISSYQEFLTTEMMLNELRIRLSKISGTCDYLDELLGDPAVAAGRRSKTSSPATKLGRKLEATADEWFAAALAQSRLPTPTQPSP
jgi:hypothetical protein